MARDSPLDIKSRYSSALLYHISQGLLLLGTVLKTSNQDSVQLYCIIYPKVYFGKGQSFRHQIKVQFSSIVSYIPRSTLSKGNPVDIQSRYSSALLYHISQGLLWLGTVLKTSNQDSVQLYCIIYPKVYFGKGQSFRHQIKVQFSSIVSYIPRSTLSRGNPVDIQSRYSSALLYHISQGLLWLGTVLKTSNQDSVQLYCIIYPKVYFGKGQSFRHQIKVQFSSIVSYIPRSTLSRGNPEDIPSRYSSALLYHVSHGLL